MGPGSGKCVELNSGCPQAPHSPHQPQLPARLQPSRYLVGAAASKVLQEVPPGPVPAQHAKALALPAGGSAVQGLVFWAGLSLGVVQGTHSRPRLQLPLR